MPEKSFWCSKGRLLPQGRRQQNELMKKAVASALAAGMLAGFLPAVSFAETTHNIEQEGVSLGAGDCTGGCQGHVVTGTCDATMAWNRHKIDIDGGTHTIILRGCSIMTPGSGGVVHTASSALDVHNGANVTLVLEGENELHGDTNHPAIWVEPGCALTIEGTGALNAYAAAAPSARVLRPLAAPMARIQTLGILPFKAAPYTRKAAAAAQALAAVISWAQAAQAAISPSPAAG